jgi:SAM-dependent methyltransferase
MPTQTSPATVRSGIVQEVGTVDIILSANRQGRIWMNDLRELRTAWKTDEQHTFSGWDFSHLAGRWSSDPVPCTYGSIIREELKPADNLLDMGTGGGEFVATLGHPYAKTSVTEGWAPNIAVLRERMVPLGIALGAVDDDDQLPFPDAAFDFVTNRHESYDPAEVARLLRPGGLFVTQQVGSGNNRDLVTFLLPGTPEPFPGHDLAHRRRDLEAAGLVIEQAAEAFPVTRFLDVGALVYYATVIQWEFPGFGVDGCFDRLVELHRRLESGTPLTSREHRFLLVARRGPRLRRPDVPAQQHVPARQAVAHAVHDGRSFGVKARIRG